MRDNASYEAEIAELKEENAELINKLLEFGKHHEETENERAKLKAEKEKADDTFNKAVQSYSENLTQQCFILKKQPTGQRRRRRRPTKSSKTSPATG
jgi:cell shape-determining protein MreC